MKLNQLKAGAALSYISMGLGYIISIIYTPIMLRLLGQSEYGLYNLVASVVSYLGLLNFGFGSAYIRYYSRYKVNNDQKNIAKLNGMFLIIFSIIGFIALLAGMVLVFYTDTIFGEKLTLKELSTAKILMAIMVINIGLSFPNVVFNSYVTANEQFVFQKLLQMFKVIANPFLVLPVLLLGYGSVGMVVITTLLNISIEIANIVFCFKKLNMKMSFKQFDFSLMKEMTIFSSFIFINMIVDQINWNVDKFILGRIEGTSEVAIYSIGAQLNTYLVRIATVISSVFIPKINHIAAKDSNKGLTRIFIKIGRLQYIFVLLIVIGFIVFGQSFVNFWAGEVYSRSYYVAVLLMVPMVTTLIQNIGIEIRKAKNKHKIPAVFMIIVACVNIIITVPLSMMYGAIGSAIGTSISVIINQIFINIYYQKVIGIDILLFWKEIIQISKGAIIPIFVAIILKMNDSYFSDLSLVLLMVLFTIIYLISMYILGFNDFEKNYLLMIN